MDGATRAGSWKRARATKKTPSGKSSRESSRGLDGQAGLARPARPEQGDQAHVRAAQELVPDGVDLPVAPDEGGGHGGEVVRPALQGAQGREVGRQVRVQQLVDRLRPGEVAQPVLAQGLQAGAVRQGVPHQVGGDLGERAPARRGPGPSGARSGRGAGRSSGRPTAPPRRCAAPSAPAGGPSRPRARPAAPAARRGRPRPPAEECSNAAKMPSPSVSKTYPWWASTAWRRMAWCRARAPR